MLFVAQHVAYGVWKESSGISYESDAIFGMSFALSFA